MTESRKIVVERIREEGREAFRQGKVKQTCPPIYMGTMDRFQWEQGYDEEKASTPEKEVTEI